MTMNSRQRILEIASRGNPDKVGFWLGIPHEETLRIYGAQLNLPTDHVVDHFESDCCFLCADFFKPWKHPLGKPPIWEIAVNNKKKGHSQDGPFAEFTSVNDVDKFDWPDPLYFDFTEASQRLMNDKYRDKAILSGSWSFFFHVVADLFGMEQYFMKMHTEPAVVEAVTDRVVDFFVQANERFCQMCAPYFDVMFYGNDFGCQQDLIMSPDMFAKFVLPGLKRLIDVAKKYDKYVMLHSCGSIYKIIPLLIEAGVDMLHPLQARATGMDAVSLARLYKGKIAFVGAVDTQELLVHGTPQMVMDEVRRLKDIFGHHYIVSPSHEAILPDVPLENVEAMARVAKE